MKRLVALIFLLAVCGAGGATGRALTRTVKNIAYRDAGGDRNIDTMCRLDLYYPADGRDSRPSYGTTAAA